MMMSEAMDQRLKKSGEREREKLIDLKSMLIEREKCSVEKSNRLDEPNANGLTLL